MARVRGSFSRIGLEHHAEGGLGDPAEEQVGDRHHREHEPVERDRGEARRLQARE